MKHRVRVDALRLADLAQAETPQVRHLVVIHDGNRQAGNAARPGGLRGTSFQLGDGAGWAAATLTGAASSAATCQTDVVMFTTFSSVRWNTALTGSWTAD